MRPDVTVRTCWVASVEHGGGEAALFRGNRPRQCAPSKECTRLIGPAQAGYGGPRTGPTPRVSTRYEAFGKIVDGGNAQGGDGRPFSLQLLTSSDVLSATYFHQG